MNTKVFQVDKVELRLMKSNPPQLVVTASGIVSSAGWDNGELKILDIQPSDGIYQFDFCATPPNEETPQLMMEISATYVYRDIPMDLKGVMIHSSSNSIVQQTGSEVKSDAGFTPHLETLMAVQIEDGKLKLRVPTGGCTSKESFWINVIKGFTGHPPYILEVHRIVPDFCKGYFPEGILIEYDLEELGIEPLASFALQNKIGRTIL